MRQMLLPVRDDSRWSREAPQEPAAGRALARATSRPAWRGSFPAEADRSPTEAPRWPSSGLEAEQASGYAPIPDKTEMAPPPQQRAWGSSLYRDALNFEKSVGLNQICASSVHRAHDLRRAPHPPRTECRALASSIPAAAGQWPMPDVGHSYWGCSSSILRMKHSCEPIDVRTGLGVQLRCWNVRCQVSPALVAW